MVQVEPKGFAEVGWELEWGGGPGSLGICFQEDRAAASRGGEGHLLPHLLSRRRLEVLEAEVATGQLLPAAWAHLTVLPALLLPISPSSYLHRVSWGKT